MALPERVQELLKEFDKVQARPITDAALAERMRSEATTWINAVHMQYRRASVPLVDPDEPGEEVWRQEIDLHFLLVALTRLRRAVDLTTRVGELRGKLAEQLADFDARVPWLRLLRNVAEHFDDYTTGEGRDSQVRRSQLQVWSLGDDGGGGLVWRWLGVELPLEATHAAATTLYRSFLDIVNNYFASERVSTNREDASR